MKPDCRRCGACCTGSESYDSVANLDIKLDFDRIMKLSKRTRKRVLVVDYRTSTASTGTKKDRWGNVVCAALLGSVNNGESPSRCSCSIYENRPYVCRVFPAGSRICLEARKGAGINA